MGYFFIGFWAAVIMEHFWFPMSLCFRLAADLILGCSAAVLCHCLAELWQEGKAALFSLSAAGNSDKRKGGVG